MNTLPKLLTLAVIGVPGQSPCAQSVLRDINATPPDKSASSNPRGFARLGNLTLFVADEPDTGAEVWRSDGTAAGTELVIDLQPGKGSAIVNDLPKLISLGNIVLFAAKSDSDTGLWRTDGTARGTTRLTDISVVVWKDSLLRDGQRMWFVAQDPVHGSELWVTDGMKAGTRRVTDINPGTGFAMTSRGERDEMAVLNGKLYFKATDGTSGYEAWVTDGSVSGTVRLADLAPGSAASDPYPFVPLGNLMLFSASPRGFTRYWYVTDGTPAGTAQVSAQQLSRPSSWLYGVVGNKFVYRFYDGAAGSEPWVTDGTAAGTHRLHDINQGLAGSFPQDFTAARGRLFFTAVDANHGRELWQTDGTLAGTKLAIDLVPGTGSPRVSWLTVVGNQLVFTAKLDANVGHELYVSDGTAVGTRLVADLAPGADSSYPSRLTAVGTQLWFTAIDPVYGYEPWRSDLSRLGTLRVANLATATAGSAPKRCVSTGHRGLILANDSVHGQEFWITDGTSNGTKLLADLTPGRLWTSEPGMLIEGDDLWITADGALWRTNLAVTNLRRIVNLSSIGGEIVRGHGKLLFRGSGALWSSDGTANGTRMVRDFAKGFYPVPPRNFFECNGRAYFEASEGSFNRSHTSGLWTTDGTTAGTKLLIPAGIGVGQSGLIVHQALSSQAGAPLIVGVGGYGFELWTVKGTVATKFATLSHSARSPASVGFVALGKRILFTGGTAATGLELWSTDGTAAGTGLVADLLPGPGGSAPTELCAAGDRVFFVIDDTVRGRELWSSDGTAAGTRLVSDIYAGAMSSDPQGLFCPGGRHVVFSARTQSTGREPWVSDGSAGGTRILADLNPGIRNSSPAGFSRFGANLLLTANHRTAGREPFVIPLGLVGAPANETFGAGCPGTAGVTPQIRADHLPVIGNTNYSIDIVNAQPNAAAMIWIALESAWVPLGGCTVLTGQAVVSLLTATDASGGVHLLLPTPNNASLVGLEIVSQALVIDSNGGFFGAASLTGALRSIVGR